MVMLRMLLLTTSFLFCWELHGQIVLSGHVVDSMDQPINNASITYKEIGSAAVLGYAMSKADGSFRLVSKATGVDSIELVVTHLSFRKHQLVIANRSADHTIRLQAGNTELAEVDVAPFPIFKRRDTINYAVDAFTAKQDRVIGDIIKKLPGIEVENGRILYQGKPIQKYMVNNLDLMEGRYGLINDNLPAETVKNVQIVENDQPIKILDSVASSDRASLNLELKNPVTTSGTGQVGAGGGPILWALNLTPMVFAKTFQMLSSIQTNNTGDDAARSLRPFYTGGHLLAPSRNNTTGVSYLSVRNVASPGFDEAKWLDNQLFLQSVNTLKKLPNGLEIKGNVSFYNDRRQRRGFTATDVFAPDRQILLTEAVDNRYGINDLTVGMLVEKNEKHVYLRNRLTFNGRWNRDRGALQLNNDENVLQHRSHDDFSLLNTLSLARFIGKQLVTISSNMEITSTPQYLSVHPGQLSDALNGGEAYERMQQHINHRAFRTENELSFVRRMGPWSLTPSFALNYLSNRFQTSITTTVAGADNRLGQGYVNDMVAGSGQFTGGLRFNYEGADWKFNGFLPYSFHLFDVTQQGTRPLRQVGRSTFNPTASLRHNLTSRQELAANASFGQVFEGLDNFYNAYIINTYRSLQRYSARLLGSTNTNAGLSYRYNHTLRGIFANASYSFTFRDQDYIMRAQVDSLAQTVVSIEDRHGKSGTHRLNAGYGHFFSAAKTVVKVNADLSFGQADYLLNDVLAKRTNRSWGTTVEVNHSKWDFLGLFYKLEHRHAHTLLAMGQFNTVIYQNHSFQLATHIGERHSLSAKNAYYLNNIEGLGPQYFLDFSYTYHLKKWRTDIVLNAQNLLDNNRFTQRFSNDFQLVETYFDLRPRQFLVSTRFRF